MWEKRNEYRILVGKSERKKKKQVESLGINGRIVLKCILKETE
jgi:hypothetical protein